MRSVYLSVMLALAVLAQAGCKSTRPTAAEPPVSPTRVAPAPLPPGPAHS